MSMFPSRPQAVARAAQPNTGGSAPAREADQHVVNFLQRFRDAEDHRDVLAERCSQLEAALQLATSRLKDQANLIATLTAQRDRYMRSSAEIGAHIVGIVSACQNAEKAALAAARDTGMVMPATDLEAGIADVAAENIGRRFGSGRSDESHGEEAGPH